MSAPVVLLGGVVYVVVGAAFSARAVAVFGRDVVDPVDRVGLALLWPVALVALVASWVV